MEIGQLVLEKIFEGFYHILLVWRPPWSCAINTLNFLLPKSLHTTFGEIRMRSLDPLRAPININMKERRWNKTVQWFLRKAGFNFDM